MNRNIALIISLVTIAAGAGAYVFLPKSTPSTSVIGHAILPELSKTELIQSSTVIVLAKVKEVQSGKYPSKIREGEEDIISTVNLEVEKYLYNPENITAKILTVQTLGGSVGEMRMIVSESPSFKIGDRTLVFLRRDPRGIFTVNGWVQGKYTVGANMQIGVGSEELSRLRNIFGRDLTVDEMTTEIGK